MSFPLCDTFVLFRRRDHLYRSIYSSLNVIIRTLSFSPQTSELRGNCPLVRRAVELTPRWYFAAACCRGPRHRRTPLASLQWHKEKAHKVLAPGPCGPSTNHTVVIANIHLTAPRHATPSPAPFIQQAQYRFTHFIPAPAAAFSGSGYLKGRFTRENWI